MKPYISFIVAARNDNYGGNFLHRLRVFLNVLLGLWDECELNAELIIVEWNPPYNNPHLKDVLDLTKVPRPSMVRIIQVPSDIHNKLPNSGKMAMFEYFAKNVGIRRAKGEYVLVTNPDVLFSEELIAYLASEKLCKKRFYRINRFDFRGSISMEATSRAILRFAKSHVYRINIREDRRIGLCIHIDWLRRWYYLLSGKWPGSYGGYRHSKTNKEPVIPLNDDTGIYGGVYTNASGDFLLASLESFKQIRGFPEFSDTFTHLDGYGCHQLKALGLEQAVFVPPCMILHADHHREEQKSRPKVSSNEWENDLQKIRAGLLGPAINDENWGLADEELPEMTVREGSNLK